MEETIRHKALVLETAVFWKIRPLHRVRGSGIVQEHPPDGAVNTLLLLPLDMQRSLDPPGQRRGIPHRVVEHVQICASRNTESELEEGNVTMKGQVTDLKRTGIFDKF